LCGLCLLGGGCSGEGGGEREREGGGERENRSAIRAIARSSMRHFFGARQGEGQRGVTMTV